MRRNIDAWWPLVAGLTSEGKVEAIVMNASGCGATVKDYGHALAHDPDYADKARRVSALTRDISELLPDLVPRSSPSCASPRPRSWPSTRRARCSTASSCAAGSKAPGALGFEVSWRAAESHLCCGSAGTYSVLQPELATQLRDRKLAHLAPLQAQAIVGQHRLHPAPADRHHHAGAALGGRPGRGAAPAERHAAARRCWSATTRWPHEHEAPDQACSQGAKRADDQRSTIGGHVYPSDAGSRTRPAMGQPAMPEQADGPQA
jgi:hypothetical protein